MSAPVLDGLKIRKSRDDEYWVLGTRYDVFFDGVKLGWVWKSSRGEWSGHALIGDSAYEAVTVSRGEPTRRWTVQEILFQVRRNGGAVRAFDVESFDHEVRVSVERINQELGIDEF